MSVQAARALRGPIVLKCTRRSVRLRRTGPAPARQQALAPRVRAALGVGNYVMGRCASFTFPGTNLSCLHGKTSPSKSHIIESASTLLLSERLKSINRAQLEWVGLRKQACGQGLEYTVRASDAKMRLLNNTIARDSWNRRWELVYYKMRTPTAPLFRLAMPSVPPRVCTPQPAPTRSSPLRLSMRFSLLCHPLPCPSLPRVALHYAQPLSF